MGWESTSTPTRRGSRTTISRRQNAGTKPRVGMRSINFQAEIFPNRRLRQLIERLKRNEQSVVLLQIFDCNLGGVRNRLTVVVLQKDQTRQRFLRVKSFERLDRGNAHVRTLIVKGIKQRSDGTSITDLPQRPCNFVIDIRVFQEWNEHRDGLRISEFP